MLLNFKNMWGAMPNKLKADGRYSVLSAFERNRSKDRFCSLVSRVFSPLHIFLQGDNILVTLLFHLFGLFASGIEIGVGDELCLDSRKALLVYYICIFLSVFAMP